MFALARAVSIAARVFLAVAIWVLKGGRQFHRSPIDLREHLLARTLEQLGGAFPKIGQILATRADLLPDSTRRALCRLQDDLEPLPPEVVADVISRNNLGRKIRDFDRNPVASASIAQVHRATRVDDGRLVAVKILRPNVRSTLQADCAIARIVGTVLAVLPPFRCLPIAESIAEVSHTLLQQTDFELEARNLHLLHHAFEGHSSIRIPQPHLDLSNAEIIVMDYLDGLAKLGEGGLSAETTGSALTAGLGALYRMIFHIGLIHCDLHPGNMWITADGSLAIVDAGFVSPISPPTRRSFAEFFLAIAMRDARAAARIVRETAKALPVDLKIDAFDADIGQLICKTGGLKAKDFQVAGFVAELFAIQRRHRILGTSQFTSAILALLVYEGVVKQHHPSLDFQSEAIPHVRKALARTVFDGWDSTHPIPRVFSSLG